MTKADHRHPHRLRFKKYNPECFTLPVLCCDAWCTENPGFFQPRTYPRRLQFSEESAVDLERLGKFLEAVPGAAIPDDD